MQYWTNWVFISTEEPSSQSTEPNPEEDDAQAPEEAKQQSVEIPPIQPQEEPPKDSPSFEQPPLEATPSQKNAENHLNQQSPRIKDVGEVHVMDHIITPSYANGFGSAITMLDIGVIDTMIVQDFFKSHLNQCVWHTIIIHIGHHIHVQRWKSKCM